MGAASLAIVDSSRERPSFLLVVVLFRLLLVGREWVVSMLPTPVLSYNAFLPPALLTLFSFASLSTWLRRS